MSAFSKETRISLRKLGPFKRGRSRLVEVVPRLIDELEAAEESIRTLSKLLKSFADDARYEIGDGGPKGCDVCSRGDKHLADLTDQERAPCRVALAEFYLATISKSYGEQA